MPEQKQLTAYVKLDTTKAERALSNLQKKINAVNTAVNKSTSSQNKVTASINKSATAMDKVSRSVEKSERAANRLNTTVNNTTKASDRMAASFRRSNTSVNDMVRGLQRASALVMSIMGASKALGVVDQITSAENRLNYVNGYDTNATEEDLRKMFNAAMGARAGYMDMVTNVSKSMALAGSAFGNNMDTAIRFQEVLSKAYTVGGATQAETAASMGQLIQALGAGVLAGDELKAVREGAPLAYKAIEKFAQGVYNTTDSLKDMGSEGKITSDIVVAGILSAGQAMDEAFEHMDMTYGQAFTLIQNRAVESFRPVMEAMTEFLNSDAGQQILSGIMFAIDRIAQGLTFIFNFLSSHSDLVLAFLNAVAVILTVQILTGLINMSMAIVAINPIILGVGVAFMAVIYIVNKLSDSSVNAFGLMAGTAAATATVIYDVFALCINSIQTLIANLVDYTTSLFSGLMSNVVLVARAIDAATGSNYASKFSTDFRSLPLAMEYKSPVDAFNTWNNKVSSMISNVGSSGGKLTSYSGYGLSGVLDPSSVSANPIADDVSKIKDSTSKIADSTKISEDYLKLLRQVAEDSYRRGLTSINIEVAMNNNATVKSESDLDGLVSKLTQKLEEELASTAAGVFA